MATQIAKTMKAIVVAAYATGGSVSYLVQSGGVTFAFSGDALYGPGQLWDLHSLQKGQGEILDYHGFLGNRRKLAASLRKLAACGAEVLVPRVRRLVSPRKCSTEEWLEVMRAAHRLGMPTTATMMYGHLETLPERLEHLDRLRARQDETGGFLGFIPWPFQPGNTALARRAGVRAAGGMEFLRMLAISRLYLDNVRNVQSSWVTQGLPVGQLGLCFGANDLGSTMMEERVVSAAGTTYRADAHELARHIADLGFQPAQRTTTYEVVREWPVAAGEGDG